MMTLDRRAIFVPAVSSSFFSAWQKDLRFSGRNYKWWTANSFFQYPYALISAPIGFKSAIFWRDEVGYPKDGLLMTDSGGYQIGSNRQGMAEFSPIVSLRWQERNADIAFNLDVPLSANSGFESSLEKSLENYTLFERERENFSMKLYNVLHGDNIHQFERWLAATRDFKFDGWAVGSSSNTYEKVLAYLILHERDAPNLQGNIHFFGTSSLRNMLAFAVLSKHFNTAITFDSSSYLEGAKRRRWLQPMSARHLVNVGRNAVSRMEVNPCRCPVCRACSIDDLYCVSNHNVTPMLLSLHNLYQFIAVNDEVNRTVENEDALVRYAEARNELKLVQNITGMLDQYDREGYHSVYERYRSLLIRRQTKQRAGAG